MMTTTSSETISLARAAKRSLCQRCKTTKRKRQGRKRRKRGANVVPNAMNATKKSARSGRLSSKSEKKSAVKPSKSKSGSVRKNRRQRLNPRKRVPTRKRKGRKDATKSARIGRQSAMPRRHSRRLTMKRAAPLFHRRWNRQPRSPCKESSRRTPLGSSSQSRITRRRQWCRLPRSMPTTREMAETSAASWRRHSPHNSEERPSRNSSQGSARSACCKKRVQKHSLRRNHQREQPMQRKKRRCTRSFLSSTTTSRTQTKMTSSPQNQPLPWHLPSNRKELLLHQRKRSLLCLTMMKTTTTRTTFSQRSPSRRLMRQQWILLPQNRERSLFRCSTMMTAPTLSLALKQRRASLKALPKRWHPFPTPMPVLVMSHSLHLLPLWERRSRQKRAPQFRRRKGRPFCSTTTMMMLLLTLGWAHQAQRHSRQGRHSKHNGRRCTPNSAISKMSQRSRWRSSRLRGRAAQRSAMKRLHSRMLAPRPRASASRRLLWRRSSVQQSVQQSVPPQSRAAKSPHSKRASSLTPRLFSPAPPCPSSRISPTTVAPAR